VATTPEDRPGSAAASEREARTPQDLARGGELEPHTEEHLLDEFEGERPGRKLHGAPAAVLAVLGAALSLFAIYWVFEPMSAQQYRPIFLAVALLLTFMVFRGGQRRNRADHPEENPTPLDWLLGIAALVTAGYAAITADELFRRAAAPETLDVVFGIAAMLLILEATRRTVGWVLPAIVLAFVAYAYLGGLIPSELGLAHKGYGVDRIVGQGYMGLEGVFGIPLDVAATYIVLFTIYGAVLEYSGAARFFVEISYAAFGRSRTGPGRTTTLAGFLLGTVSGSGVATTVTLGSVTWPLLRRAGYPRTRAAASSRRPASARSSRRPRSALPPSSSPSSWRSPTCRCSSTRSSRRSSTTSGSCSRSRPTRAASRCAAWTSTPPGSSGCSPAGATTSRR